MSEQRLIMARRASKLFDLPLREVLSDERLARIMPARFAMYKALRMRDAKKWSYPKIAKIFRKKDHSTIMHGVKRAEYIMERSPEYTAKVLELRDMSLQPPALSEEEIAEALDKRRQAYDPEGYLRDAISNG